MMVLLPEGRAINNPDTIKMVKICHYSAWSNFCCGGKVG